MLPLQVTVVTGEVVLFQFLLLLTLIVLNTKTLFSSLTLGCSSPGGVFLHCVDLRNAEGQACRVISGQVWRGADFTAAGRPGWTGWAYPRVGEPPNQLQPQEVITSTWDEDGQRHETTKQSGAYHLNITYWRVVHS